MNTKSMTRREFAGSMAAMLAALGWDGCIGMPKGEECLPAWKPGDLDLHFIYTGCGENMFYRLPDGTAILNDVGDYYRPRDLNQIPLLPSPDRLGGEWVARYIQRIYPEKTLDYALFSHWHGDHIGHAVFDQKKTPNGHHRFRVTSDGRKLNGFLCVAEEFKVKRIMVHDYEFADRYKSADSSKKMLAKYLSGKPNGTTLEKFNIGALNQICLQRNPAKYRDSFSIRNLCANGKIWDGKDGVIDFAADHVKATGKKKINQNMLSMGFVMRYGKFGYLAAGDFQRDLLKRTDGGTMLADGHLGKLAGKVNILKMLHHGCTNAMSQQLLDAVQADTHISCMWCPGQSSAEVMSRIVQAGTVSGEKPLILPQVVCNPQRKWAKEKGWDFGFTQAVHIVVRVAPGGDTYRVYLLDAADESMKILATFDKTCA